MTEIGNYESAFDFLMDLEGYKSNDSGGPTIYGITKKWYPGIYESMMGKLPEEQRDIASSFYRDEFWGPSMMAVCPNYDCGCEKGNICPEREDCLKLIELVFFQAVNMPKEIVLRNANRSNSCSDSYKDVLVVCYNHYGNIADRNPSKYLENLRGWCNRLRLIQERHGLEVKQ